MTKTYTEETDMEQPDKKLSLLDTYLTLWIFLAMAIGVAIGYYSPAVMMMITNFPIGNSSIPIAIGIILMMYLRLRFKKFGICCDEVGI